MIITHNKAIIRGGRGIIGEKLRVLTASAFVPAADLVVWPQSVPTTSCPASTLLAPSRGVDLADCQAIIIIIIIIRHNSVEVDISRARKLVLTRHSAHVLFIE
jgi:hypothetical protein